MPNDRPLNEDEIRAIARALAPEILRALGQRADEGIGRGVRALLGRLLLRLLVAAALAAIGWSAVHYRG